MRSSAGATLLRGGCYEYEATTPYLPFVEAFREWTRRQSPAQLRAALGATAPEIAKFAPEIEAKLGALAANAPLSPGEERLRLFDNAARFLRVARRRQRPARCSSTTCTGPTRARCRCCTICCATCATTACSCSPRIARSSSTARTRSPSALVEWNRERLATRVALGRLSRADTGALLSPRCSACESVSEEFVAALYRETEGNPFFIEEVVKSLIEQGADLSRAGAAGGARRRTSSPSRKASRKRSAGGLTPPERGDGRCAAQRRRARQDLLVPASSPPCPPRPRTRCSTRSTRRAPRSSSAPNTGDRGAVAAGDDSFAFTHDKIREVLYEELNPIRRRRLHQRIGEALEKLYGAAAERRARERTARAGPRPSLHAGRRPRRVADLLAPRGAQRRARVRARRGAQVPGAGARVRRGAAARRRAARDRRADRRHPRRARHDAAGGRRATSARSPRRPAAAARAALKAKIGNAYCAVGDPRGLPYLEAGARRARSARPRRTSSRSRRR